MADGPSKRRQARIDEERSKPQEVRLTPGKLVRVKDNIGNTLGMMKLEDGELLLYPSGPIRVWDNPLTVSVPMKR